MSLLPIKSLSPTDILEIEARLGTKTSPNSSTYFNTNPAARDTLASLSKEDDSMLELCRVTTTQIADCLDSLIARAQLLWKRAGRRGHDQMGCQESGAILNNLFHVTLTKSNPSPHDCAFCGPVSNEELYCRFTVTNTKTNENFTISRLFCHMVRHGFFGGSTDLRVSPEKLVRVLELKPGAIYKAQTITKKYWDCSESSTTATEDEQVYKRKAKQVLQIEDLRCYLYDENGSENMYMISPRPRAEVINNPPVQIGDGQYDWNFLFEFTKCYLKERTDVVLQEGDRLDSDAYASWVQTNPSWTRLQQMSIQDTPPIDLIAAFLASRRNKLH